MAADLRADAGRHHIDGVELPSGFAVPPPQYEYGVTVFRDGNIRTYQAADFAKIFAVVDRRDHQPNGNFPFGKPERQGLFNMFD